jgi:hypothetical protein
MAGTTITMREPAVWWSILRRVYQHPLRLFYLFMFSRSRSLSAMWFFGWSGVTTTDSRHLGESYLPKHQTTSRLQSFLWITNFDYLVEDLTILPRIQSQPLSWFQ